MIGETLVIAEPRAIPERFNVLGVGIDSINMNKAIERIIQWIEQREKNYVTITGVHGVMESQQKEDIRQIHNQAGMVTPDGMPLVWIGKYFGHNDIERVYGPDLMLNVCKKSITQGYRHYLYGGKKGVPELLKNKLEEKFPGIQIVGTYSPPFRNLSIEEDNEIIQMINNTRPDIVWIGLSTPKQELWMANNKNKLNAPVQIGVGAAFDFHSGLIKQAPLWMQKNGLEWLFRLWIEPRRLWKRYFRNNPLFIFLIVKQLLGLRRYKI